MRRAALAALTAAALTACGGPIAPAAPTTVIVTVPVPAPAAPAPTFAPAEMSWTMPNLVGSGLQDAQDAIQRLTGYGIAVTSSHDATGAGRMQLSDRNWKVCSQNVAPGETITSGTQIDFGVVKLDEDC